MKYNKINNLLGWLCGIVATLVYVMTADRYNSWWDTGEFVASAFKLEIVHQPGAPLFLMIQNLFSNMAMGNVGKVAFWMNVGSAVCSGLTIVFLFWTITALARKVIVPSREIDISSVQIVQIIASGVIGALAYAFTDTFWYSAVESEVYAMSSLCTAVVFWLILKWEYRADDPDANRWLLVIAFVMGLSIGVHLLNLLTIPALALVVYFRKAKQITVIGISKSLGLGMAILAFVLWGIIQYGVKIAAYTDLFFVNSLGLGFGSGILFFVAALVSLLITGLLYAVKKSKPILQLSLLGICFVLFGFSSYAMLLIRSDTNISLNNASPDNVFSFLGYLSREQYQSEPLFKGPTFNSRTIHSEAQYTYRKDEGKYVKIEGGAKYAYDNEMLFPRLYSERHKPFYQFYLNLQPNQNPDFGDNLNFFLSYQLNHMYGRYFMWNFTGRQNDTQGHGGMTAGNWLSGIRLIDQVRLGGQDALSESLADEPSRNVYFFLPFILGISGLIWQIRKRKQDALVVGLLFFFTGIAIVIYLNQTPMQPRERDYAYAGSFYMFAVWIGLGVLALVDFFQKYISLKKATISAFVFAALCAPVLLVVENWDDHDRSDRGWTRDMAYNYLASCEPNSILFTYADNDTFPLWYLQEVEGVRTDVRIVNLSYLQSDWYMKQAMKDINQAKALPFNIQPSQIEKGVRDVIFVHDLNVPDYTELDTLLQIMLSDNPNNKLPLANGKHVNILPTKKIQLTIDKDTVLRHKVVPREWEDAVSGTMQWTYNKDYVTRAELGMMAILAYNNWERPIYFANMLSSEQFIGLDKYLVNEGLVYRLMPVEMNQAEAVSVVNTDTLYKNITENFKWGNIASIRHFDTDYKSFIQPFLFDRTVNLALDTLVEKAELDKARKVALLAYENMPKKVTSMDHARSNVIVVDTLYKSKEMDKAAELAGKSLNYIDENLHYYQAVGGKINGFDMGNIQIAFEAIDHYRKVLENTKETQLIAKVDAMTQKYRNAFVN